MLPPKVIEKLRNRIARFGQWRFASLGEVPLEMAETMEHHRTPPGDVPYAPAPVGTAWGREWMTVWFRGEAVLPPEAAGRRIYYRHESFSEKLLFVNGVPAAGMNPHHPEVLLTPNGEAGARFQLHVEAYSGHRMANMDPCDPKLFYHQICGMDPGREPPHRLESSELLAEREALAAFHYDAQVLLGTALCLEERSLRRATILRVLNEAVDRIPMRWESEAELEAAAREARAAAAPLLAQPNAPTTPTVGLAGYGHIDIAWLWPIRETIRKAARTFTTHLALLDEYPEFTVIQSQPILIEMTAEHYPELLPRIEAHVQSGRWQPNGGMWIEGDCNMASGEALVRQFLEGQKATQERFGYTSDVLWLPDVFGYSGALPQIARHCGMEAFVTSKINWNDTTRFPYDTFWWEGIDGTRLFTHFITARLVGYNAEVTPESSWDCWEHVQQKECQDSILCSVGYGDGGGGVTRGMLERARRMNDLEGCPKTQFTGVFQFLQRLRDQAVPWPMWRGELYLELHRATYTTDGKIKWMNRRLEHLLRETELWSAMAMEHGLPYPAAELQRHWRTLLTHQCHDNLAGSCIRVTCEEIHRDHRGMEEALEALRKKALDTLVAQAAPPEEAGADYWMLANPLSWRQQALVELSGGARGLYDAEGNPCPVQVDEADGAPRVTALVTAPPMGVAIFSSSPQASHADQEAPFAISGDEIETPFYLAAFDAAGALTRLYDKEADRELVQGDRWLNRFHGAEDFPIYWDAFDIDRYYRDVMLPETRAAQRQWVGCGPLHATLRIELAVGRHSKLEQDIVFHAHTKRIDFKTRVDWRERNFLLKASFALNIQASTWRNEIQFGHIERNLHGNTPADQAQFEVCAHRWVDVSDAGYGVALLNDGKYGHDSLDGMISLTLLRACGGANEESDAGPHAFTYSLLPHAGPFEAGSVVREAHALNIPWRLEAAAPQGQGTHPSLCSSTHPGVIAEVVKRAESGDGFIVRVYEAGGAHVKTRLVFCRPLGTAALCNGLEEACETLAVDGCALPLELGPFALRTIHFTWA